MDAGHKKLTKPSVANNVDLRQSGQFVDNANTVAIGK